MRLFVVLALVAIIIFLVCVAVPTTFLSVVPIFWFGLAFAFFLADIAFGGYTVALASRRAP